VGATPPDSEARAQAVFAHAVASEREAIVLHEDRRDELVRAAEVERERAISVRKRAELVRERLANEGVE